MITIIFSGLAFLLSLTTLVFVVMKSRQKIEPIIVKDEKLQRQVAMLSKQHKLLNNSSMGVGQRLMALEQQLRHLMSRQDDIEQSKTTDVNFQHAVKLVSMGASIEEVMQSCGLSRGEAELLLTVHKMPH